MYAATFVRCDCNVILKMPLSTDRAESSPAAVVAAAVVAVVTAAAVMEPVELMLVCISNPTIASSAPVKPVVPLLGVTRTY